MVLTSSEWLFMIISFLTTFTFIAVALIWLYIRREIKILKEAIATIVAIDPELSEKISKMLRRKKE